jgi:serine/threonine protein kinase
MAYHLITGSPPFVADSTRDLYRKHLSEPPPPMNNFRDDIPEEIEKIISDGCLAKKPSRRPSSMKIVEGELRRFLL